MPGEQQEEPSLLARHFEARESVSRRDSEDEAEEDGERRHADAVGEVGRQARLEMIDLVVVGDGKRVRQVVGRNLRSLGRRLDRGEKRQHDRRQHHRDDREAYRPDQVAAAARA